MCRQPKNQNEKEAFFLFSIPFHLWILTGWPAVKNLMNSGEWKHWMTSSGSTFLIMVFKTNAKEGIYSDILTKILIQRKE